MKSKVFKFFEKLAVCSVLIFGAQLSCFAIDPAWAMNQREHAIFSKLHENVQEKLNSISNNLFNDRLNPNNTEKDNLDYLAKNIHLCVKNNKEYANRIIYVTGFAGPFEKVEFDCPRLIVVNVRLLRDITHASCKTIITNTFVNTFNLVHCSFPIKKDGSKPSNFLHNMCYPGELKNWSIYAFTPPSQTDNIHTLLPHLTDEIFPIPNKIRLYDKEDNLDKFLDSFKNSLTF